MTRSLQAFGLAVLALLAVLMLVLIGIVILMLAKHIGPDGRVPSSDALGLTALLLSFREIIASIRGIFDGADLTGKLAASAPVAPPAVEPDADAMTTGAPG